MRTLSLRTAPLRVGLASFITVTCLVAPAFADSLRGVVETGSGSSAKPLANVTVTLYEATVGLPKALGHATTNSSGKFVIDSPKDTTSSIFFASADVGKGVELVTILGVDLPFSTTINELTTVAASYSMAQFYRTGVISGNSFGLRIAAGMNDNIVSPATGKSSPVLLTSPNADETNSLRSTRSLANLLAACVHDPGTTVGFFDLTKFNGSLPRNTAQALANLARNPGKNVDSIYQLTKLEDSYSPALVRAPDAWMVTVKINDSGDDRKLIAGPGRLVFDASGYAWVSNNVKQGKKTSGRFMVVFQPNGKPADGAYYGTPISPVTGGGILGGGYGMTIDPQGTIWEGNFGWGGVDPTPTGNGSVSQFTPSGEPISGPLGYQGGPVRAQGMVSDAEGNIWICSYGTDSIFVFLHGDPGKSISFQEYKGSQPFDIALAADGSVWVSNGGGLAGAYPSSVAKFALVNGKIKRQFIVPVGKALKGIALDSLGNAWVASQGDSKIWGIRDDSSIIGGFDGGGIDSPWGITVDGEDNLWAVNFGPLTFGNNFTPGRLSKLYGDNPATRPVGKKVGDPISPSTGYTVLSAGSPVLLHNGDPLYGPGADPSFTPMMRQTAAPIDQAGNIWSLNNFKPNFTTEAPSNPGGDGIVIFVGLAPPPAKTSY